MKAYECDKYICRDFRDFHNARFCINKETQEEGVFIGPVARCTRRATKGVLCKPCDFLYEHSIPEEDEGNE